MCTINTLRTWRKSAQPIIHTDTFTVRNPNKLIAHDHNFVWHHVHMRYWLLTGDKKQILHSCNVQTNKWLKRKEVSKRFHKFQFAGETKLLLYFWSEQSRKVCCRTANQTAHGQLNSAAFTMKLTKFSSLSRHQLASVLHRRNKCLHSALSTATRLRLNLELMLELMLTQWHRWTQRCVRLLPAPTPNSQTLWTMSLFSIESNFPLFLLSEWAD